MFTLFKKKFKKGPPELMYAEITARLFNKGLAAFKESVNMIEMVPENRFEEKNKKLIFLLYTFRYTELFLFMLYPNKEIVSRIGDDLFALYRNFILSNQWCFDDSGLDVYVFETILRQFTDQCSDIVSTQVKISVNGDPEDFGMSIFRVIINLCFGGREDDSIVDLALEIVKKYLDLLDIVNKSAIEMRDVS